MQFAGKLSPRITPIALALSGILPLSDAGAEERTLAPVVVSEKVAAETAVVTGAEVERRAARNLGEVLQDTPGVTIGGGPAIAQKIYVRGIEDTLLGTTLDGAPQTGRTFHHQSRLLIDPELIKSVELDRGSAPASAGPGALAGSLRLTTKDGRDLLRPGQTLGAMLRGGMSSNDGGRVGASLYGLAGEAFDFLLSGNRSDTDDYEDGHGTTQENSGSTQQSGLAKFNWRVAPAHRLSLGYQRVEDEGVRYLRPNMWGLGAVRNGPPMPQQTERDTLTATWRYDGDGRLPGLELTVFADEMSVERTTPTAQPRFNKPAGYRFGEAIDARGANLLLNAKLGDVSLRYGLNHHRFEASAINARAVDGSSSGREKSGVDGLFVEGRLPLGAHFVVDAGMRYDWYRLTDNHAQKFTSDGASPSASLTWLATDTLSFRLAASRTHRGPGLKEAFYIDNTLWKNDPDLKAETAENVELGFGYADGPWRLKGSVFHLTIDDYISTGNYISPTSTSITNVGDAKSTGYELSGGWTRGPFRAGLAVAYARPKLNGYDLGSASDGLGVSTGRTWTLDLGYQVAAWHLDLGWVSRLVEKHEYTDLPASTKVKDGYAVHDLHANWQPLGQDRLRLTFSVRNLFDAFYYDQGTYAYVDSAGNTVNYGYAEPGRDVRLDLSWKF
jgi:hemoglobin/transferrin/lactoferrin receptor protein